MKPHCVNLVIDVRSIPYSRYAPQFNRASIQQSLNQYGLAYEYFGDVIGGKFTEPIFFNENGVIDFHKVIKSELFQRGLDTVIEKIHDDTKLVLMCAEKDPLYCHRFLLISRELNNRGVHPIHLLADGSVINHDELLNNITYGKKQSDFVQIGLLPDNQRADTDMVYESLMREKMKKKR